MLSRLFSTLLFLSVLYLLSAGPMHRLEAKGTVPHRFYDTFYQKPVATLETVPVAGPLLHRYIDWCTQTPIPEISHPKGKDVASVDRR